MRPPRRRGDRRLPRANRHLCRGQPRPAVDPGRGLVPRRLPGWPRTPGGPRPGGPGSAGLPAQQGRPRRLGQQPRPRARGHHGRHAGSPRRPDRTGSRRDAARHPPRGRPGAGRATHPGRPPRRSGNGACSRASRTCTGIGITNWQDAIVDARRPRDVPAGRRSRRPHGARRRGAVVGARRRARADRGAGRATGRGSGRALRRDQREADARRHHRELHGGGARSVLRPRRHADRQPGA